MTGPASSSVLAPLQRVMLRDSIAAGDAGHHVEQVEIRFSSQVDPGRVISAWKETVARTEALRISFLIENGNPAGWEPASPDPGPADGGPLPTAWEMWSEEDRCSPLLFQHQVPWRTVFWQQEGRFVWTFHHALLDGRSITRILRAFLDRVDGNPAESLALSRWQPPDQEMKRLGDELFRRTFAAPEAKASAPPAETPGGFPAVRCLGCDSMTKLESQAARMDVTPATILIWAWGQALAKASGQEAVVMEQVRAGTPQEGTAGFTMGLLPVSVRRGEVESLRELRSQLLDFRQIESMGPEDFSPGVFPHVDGRWNSVIMIERGTPGYLIGKRPSVESLTLHEARGETLMATACLQPDLRLEVEGPGRHVLLEGWIEVLTHSV